LRRFFIAVWPKRAKTFCSDDDPEYQANSTGARDCAGGHRGRPLLNLQTGCRQIKFSSNHPFVGVSVQSILEFGEVNAAKISRAFPPVLLKFLD
jgi:hypothetical protein